MTSLAKGATTIVDAGSAGAATFPAFRRYVLGPSDTRIYALLNISAMGMIDQAVGELEDMRWAMVDSAVATGLANPEYVVGIKARLSRETAGENDVEALTRAIEAAEALDGFVMIHVGNTKTPLEELTAMLRPGDVVTHAFHSRAEGLIDDAGRVKPGITEAQRRGVVFDVGHGAGSFAFDTAEKALADGFRPDNISSDLHVYNIEGPVHDQVSVLSKFMHLGSIPRRGDRAQHAVDRECPGRGRNAGDAAPGRRRGPHPHAPGRGRFHIQGRPRRLRSGPGAPRLTL